MKNVVLWDLELCSVIEIYRRCGVTYYPYVQMCCLIRQFHLLLKEQGSSSHQNSLNLYQATRHQVSQYGDLLYLSCQLSKAHREKFAVTLNFVQRLIDWSLRKP